MTYIKELPLCAIRFGRTSMVEVGGKLVPKCIIACGYREVDADECINCNGFVGVKFELKVDTFITFKRDRAKKGKFKKR